MVAPFELQREAVKSVRGVFETSELYQDVNVLGKDFMKGRIPEDRKLRVLQCCLELLSCCLQRSPAMVKVL